MTTTVQTESLQAAFLSQFPQEVAHIFETHSTDEVLEVLPDYSDSQISQVLAAMNPAIAAEILRHVPPPRQGELLLHMRPSLSGLLLRRIALEERKPILEMLPDTVCADIQAYLEYPDDSVGTLMDPNVFSLTEDLTIQEAMDQIRKHASRDVHDVYVVDRNLILVGIALLRDIFLAPLHRSLPSVMRREMPTINPLENREQVAEIFDQWKVLTIPVTDLDGHLLGIIRNQDIVQVEIEEATISLQTMVGASKDERALSPPMFAVRKRLPWLQINLLTAFLAAFVVGLFEDTISKFTALAVLLPVVAGQSGNTGAQALAVVMRGLALRDIRPSQWLKVTTKETLVAFMNGIAVAITTATAVYVWSASWGLTMVIGVSMVISMVMAGFSGAIIPIILRALNQDPAQSSSIVLTTVTDVAGFLSFLGLATLFSAWLE